MLYVRVGKTARPGPARVRFGHRQIRARIFKLKEGVMGVRFLNPSLEGDMGFQEAARVATLNGKVLGILYNGRAGGEVVLKELLNMLEAKYSLEGVVFRTKPHAWVSAPEEIFEEMAKSVGVAITGVGD